MKVAGNDIGAARDLLNQIPKGAHIRAPHVDLARTAEAQFVHKRFELDPRRPTEAQARDVWERTFSENLETLNRLADSLPRDTQNVITFGRPELQRRRHVQAALADEV